MFLTARYQNSHPAAPIRETARGLALIVALTVAASLAPVVACAQPSAAPLIAAIRDAVAKRDWQRLPELALRAARQRDPLLPYAEYWPLRAQLDAAKPVKPAADPAAVPTDATTDAATTDATAPAPLPLAAVHAFLKRHAGSYLADRLRGDAIVAAARVGDFAAVRQLGSVVAGNAAVGCAQLAARHAAQRLTAEQALAALIPGAGAGSVAGLAAGFTSAEACWAVLERLVGDRVLGWSQLVPWWRAAIETNRTPDARRLAQLLYTPAQLRVYDAILRDPQGWLARRSRTQPTTDSQALVLGIALARAARVDRDATDTALREVWQPLLPPAEHAWARSQLALVAALNLDPRADRWYREAGLEAPLTEYNHAWRVRSALRQTTIDWRWLRQSIARMPAGQRSEPVWVYWDARALAALGQPEAARARYAEIADAPHYYGLLAAEELGRATTPPPALAAVSVQEIAQIRAHPGLQRAVALFRAGWRAEAVPAWNFALRGMTDRQLRAAAELARAEQLYDRVVNTSERTKEEVDYAQRYVAPFAPTLTAQAHAIELDPAWVYGLIRQESRFIAEARSSAGATGLMQLMPATARWTANRVGLTDYRLAQLTDFTVNTLLGTHYLNIVLQDQGGSQLLASVGYNAGPSRARLWRARLTHPVEGAIFAETIPFTETRLYVKNVLANTTWYAAMFSGQPQSLKARLGTVEPQADAGSTVP